MNFKTVFFIPFFSALIFNAYSQQYVDILKLNASTSPSYAFDSSKASTKLNEQGADITYPIKINDSLSILTGILYESLQTKLFPLQAAYTSMESYTLKVGLSKVFNEKWSMLLLALPKISSTHEYFHPKAFQLGAITVIKVKKNENFTYKFGLYYNNDLFGPLFVPILGFYYISPNKKFESNLVLPLQADANYNIIPLLNVGLNFNGQTRSYDARYAFDPGTNATKQATYITRQTTELFSYLRFNFTKSISLQTAVGYSVGRSYKVFEEGDKVSFALPATFIGDKRTQLNEEFSDGLIYRIVLLYRFHVVKK